MSKLVEAASEFLSRDTSNKGNHRDFSEAMHPSTKKMEAKVPAGMHRMPDGKLMKDSDMPKKKMEKKEMEESFLLSQEEFHSLSEDEQEQYVSQLVELKRFTLESSCMGGKRNGMLTSGMNGMKEMDAKKMKEMKAMKEMDKMKMKRM